MAIHSSMLSWRIPWTEEPGELWSMGSQGVGHDWATELNWREPPLNLRFRVIQNGEGFFLLLWMQLQQLSQGCSEASSLWVCFYICFCLFNYFRWLTCELLSHVQLFATPQTITHQAPLLMGFSRQEYWSGLPFPSPEDLLDSGIEPWSPALQTDSLPFELQGNPSVNQMSHLELLRGSLLHDE